MLSREANEQDWVQAVPFLVEAVTVSPSCTLVDVNIELVLAYLMAAATRGGAYVIDEKYLVVYDYHPMWYAPDCMTVNEQLVLCIAPDKPGTVLAPIKFLVDEKLRLGARHLLIGDLLHTNQDKYGRVLTKLGFSKVNTVYAT